MLISQPISRCLTNHSELCMSRLLSNQSRRIFIYGLQRRPSFGFESSVSSTLMTSGDPVDLTMFLLRVREVCEVLRSACRYVCLSARSHIFKTTRPDIAKFSVRVLPVGVARSFSYDNHHCSDVLYWIGGDFKTALTGKNLLNIKALFAF